MPSHLCQDHMQQRGGTRLRYRHTCPLFVGRPVRLHPSPMGPRSHPKFALLVGHHHVPFVQKSDMYDLGIGQMCVNHQTIFVQILAEPRT